MPPLEVEDEICLRMSADAAVWSIQKLPEIVARFDIFEVTNLMDIEVGEPLPCDDATVQALLAKGDDVSPELLKGHHGEEGRFAMTCQRQSGFWTLQVTTSKHDWPEVRPRIRAFVAWMCELGGTCAILQPTMYQMGQEGLNYDGQGNAFTKEDMAGHLHRVGGMYIAPAPVSWWGPRSGHWFPPARVAAFSDGLHNEEIAPGVREIQLLETPFDNQAIFAAWDRVWALRRWLAMDEISHGRADVAPPTVEDPYAEIIEEGLPDGVLRRIRYFHDADGKPAPKSSAAGHEEHDIPSA